MNIKLTEAIINLHSVLSDLELSDKCKIKFEQPDESEIIGNEEAYLNLLKCVVSLLLVKNKILSPNDDIVQENTGLISYQIKNVIDEFSDCWLVNAQII